MAKISASELFVSLGRQSATWADGGLDRAHTVLGGDKRLVRLNLIAYCFYCIVDLSERRLGEDGVAAVMPHLLKGAAEGAGINSADKACRFFENRHLGFLHAVRDMEQNPLSLASYFDACCSVDRWEVDYADIVPHPEDLEGMASFLTPEGREFAAEIRQMHKPATYRMQFHRSETLFMLLASIKGQIREWLEQLRT